MKCSDCSNNVKPIVVFDIDGTLGNYHAHFTFFCGLYFGWDEVIDHTKYDGSVDFEDFLGITKAEYREAKLAYRQGGNKRWLPIYPEAASIVEDLAQMAEIWICTTRPWQRLDNVDPDTREWLRRHRILPHVSGLLYGDRKYFQLMETVDSRRITAVIEDLPEQVGIAKTLGLPVILRENYHNTAARNGNVTRYVPRGSLVTCRQWAAVQVAEWLVNNDDRKGGNVHTS